jgi:hypothetical protein
MQIGRGNFVGICESGSLSSVFNKRDNLSERLRKCGVNKHLVIRKKKFIKRRLIECR